MVTATEKAQREAEARFDAALEAVGSRRVLGPLDERLESVTDKVQKGAIAAYADTLGERNAFSKALRDVIERGLLAIRDERRARV